MFSSFIIQEISIEIFNTVGYVTRRYFWEKGCGKKRKSQDCVREKNCAITNIFHIISVCITQYDNTTGFSNKIKMFNRNQS